MFIDRDGFIGASGKDGEQGIVIDEVKAGSSAERAGLKVGDTVVAIDGKALNKATLMANEIGSRAPGSKITLTYLRNGAVSETTVTVEDAKSVSGN